VQYWYFMADRPKAALNGKRNYAYYSRYERKKIWDWPTGAHDLACPSCGAEEITILEEAAGGDMMLGDLVQCWICKGKFTVTGNCWKARAINGQV
jgi:hypothetical protein